MISVMQASKEGKRIQFKRHYNDEWKDCGLGMVTWDWYHIDYRIKPEQPKKKIVPYESESEFLQAQKEHGPYIKRFNMLMLPVIVEFYNNEKEINSITVVLGEKKDRIMIRNLVNNTWQDGTPIGKEVEV